MTGPFGEAAEKYRARGWLGTLPLPPRKKVPPPEGYTGEAGAYPDDRVASGWIATNSNGNIAVRMPDDVVGIDVDVYGGKVGAATLAALEDELGTLPGTYATTSRNDGVSAIRWFRVPTGLRWHDAGQHVELVWRGHRYAVAPPSVHPDTGLAYAWLHTTTWAKVDVPSPANLAELPAAWVARLSAESETKVATTYSRPNLDEWQRSGVPAELNHDDALKDVAWECRRLDYDEASARATWWAVVNNTRLTGRSYTDGDFDRHWSGADGKLSSNPFTTVGAGVPLVLEDGSFGPWLAQNHLPGWCRAPGLGWLRWDGRRWVGTDEDAMFDAVRLAVLDVIRTEMSAGCSLVRQRELTKLLSASRLNGLTRVVRAAVRVEEAFDQHHDLLNVNNGVVDLRTGTLRPHDPALRLTRLTPTSYVPRATHPDWTKALRALPPEVRRWMQVRLGQALTGYTPDDDVLPVLQGTGANGKTTVVNAVTAAAGEHAVPVSERLLMSNPGDHPTELMQLRGARLAVIEETPEARHLNVKRLKDSLGGTVITARAIRENNVSWTPTHALFVTSNYLPRVDETDHGTWRRLAAVRFPHTFRANDADRGLRARLARGAQGRHEAVLAWLVAGAQAWYADERVMPPPPPSVVADTAAWREEGDVALAFIRDRLVRAPNYAISSQELFDAFQEFLQSRRMSAWSEPTFGPRFGDHSVIQEWGVRKVKRLPASAQLSSRFDVDYGRDVRVWLGLRWNT